MPLGHLEKGAKGPGEPQGNLERHQGFAESIVFARGPFDAADELDVALQRHHERISSLISAPGSGNSQSRVQAQLQDRASRDAQEHASIVLALLYGILADESSRLRLFSLLRVVTRDGHATLVGTLQKMCQDKWAKLKPHTKSSVLWLLEQLLFDMEVHEAEVCLLCVIRQMGSGDLSDSNVQLASQILNALTTNRAAVYARPHLLTNALFSYLRLLADHWPSQQSSIRTLASQETAFCVTVLRERFQDCLVIGRDLLRLLQDLAAVPEFQQIWRDLLTRPESFGVANFTDIRQLYAIRTPTRFIASRVTPEMELQLRFLLANVQMGEQRRYQQWFALKHLSSPESESLVCDLIRFICCAIHPTNQILQSNITPRWAVIGWLLKCCRSAHVESNAKLALLYDWLFFSPQTDNIMNIEPAILCIFFSLPKYADLSNALLEFLFLLVDHYDEDRKDILLQGVRNSVDILVGKGVVPNLHLLSESTHIPLALRERIQVLFPTYCRTKPPSAPVSPKDGRRQAAAVKAMEGLDLSGKVSKPGEVQPRPPENGETARSPLRQEAAEGGSSNDSLGRAEEDNVVSEGDPHLVRPSLSEGEEEVPEEGQHKAPEAMSENLSRKHGTRSSSLEEPQRGGSTESGAPEGAGIKEVEEEVEDGAIRGGSESEDSEPTEEKEVEGEDDSKGAHELGDSSGGGDGTDEWAPGGSKAFQRRALACWHSSMEEQRPKRLHLRVAEIDYLPLPTAEGSMFNDALSKFQSGIQSIANQSKGGKLAAEPEVAMSDNMAGKMCMDEEEDALDLQKGFLLRVDALLGEVLSEASMDGAGHEGETGGMLDEDGAPVRKRRKISEVVAEPQRQGRENGASRRRKATRVDASGEEEVRSLHALADFLVEAASRTGIPMFRTSLGLDRGSGSGKAVLEGGKTGAGSAAEVRDDGEVVLEQDMADVQGSVASILLDRIVRGGEKARARGMQVLERWLSQGLEAPAWVLCLACEKAALERVQARADSCTPLPCLPFESAVVLKGKDVPLEVEDVASVSRKLLSVYMEMRTSRRQQSEGVNGPGRPTKSARQNEGKPESLLSLTRLVELPASDKDKLRSVLLADVETCFLRAPSSPGQVIPALLCLLGPMTHGCPRLLHVLLGSLDPARLAELEMATGMGEWSLVGSSVTESQLRDLLEASLSWDWAEQEWLWRLLAAEAGRLSESTLSALISAAQTVGTTTGAPGTSDDVEGDHVGSDSSNRISPFLLSGLKSVLQVSPPALPLVAKVLRLPQSSFSTLSVAALHSWTLRDTKEMTIILKDQKKILDKQVAAKLAHSLRSARYGQDGAGASEGTRTAVEDLATALLSQ